jgi:hypothetical protein
VYRWAGMVASENSELVTLMSDRDRSGDDPALLPAWWPPHPTTLIATINSVAATVMRTRQLCHGPA